MKKAFCSLALMLIIAAIIASGCGKSDSPRQDLEEVSSDVVEVRGLSLYLARDGSDMLIIFAPSDVVAERVLAEFPPILNMFPMNRSRMFP